MVMDHLSKLGEREMRLASEGKIVKNCGLFLVVDEESISQSAQLLD